MTILLPGGVTEAFLYEFQKEQLIWSRGFLSKVALPVSRDLGKPVSIQLFYVYGESDMYETPSAQILHNEFMAKFWQERVVPLCRALLKSVPPIPPAQFQKTWWRW